MEFPRPMACLPKEQDRREGYGARSLQIRCGCGGMSLREKPLQSVASNNQLTSVAYNQVLALKAGEILGYPRP